MLVSASIELYSLSTVAVIVTVIRLGVPLVAACTITKSIILPTAMASSPEVKLVEVAPLVVQTRFDDKIFAGVPSLRCRLIVLVPVSVRHLTDVI